MPVSKNIKSDVCFSEKCGMCSSCSGGESVYSWPIYMDNKSLRIRETNWDKYQKMLKVTSK